MKKFCIIIFVLWFSNCFAQDSLPNFKVTLPGKDKAVISWKNPFGITCKQISVQRSYDSLRFFRTVFSSLSPELPENGFVDNDYLAGMKNFYRIFYVLEDGSFYFTKSMSPETVKNTMNDIKKQADENDEIARQVQQALINFKPKSADKAEAETERLHFIDSLRIHLTDSINHIPKLKFYTIYKRRQKKPAFVLMEKEFMIFKDSIETKTKDTLLELENEVIIWNQYIVPAWKPSKLVYTGIRGYVELHFDDFETKKYRVIFYDADAKELFRIKHVKYARLSLDKSDFIKAGWYYFEVYDGERLVEKNKFFLETDFY